MLLELFPFVILYNVMAFIYAYFFSDFLRFDPSLLLLTVTLRGVSNKHCLLSLFSFQLNLSRVKRKRSLGFPTRFDTNRAVQPQKMARGLKFLI